MDSTRLRICEMYRSLQGESLAAGLPCTLIRLGGCDLRCRWCDTEHAFDQGTAMTVDEILAQVVQLGDDLVLITGGEPLLQRSVHTLIDRLLDRGSHVQLETGGHRPLAEVDERVEIIMDIKCPSSGENASIRLENLAHLKPTDQLKLVLADEQDYRWARDLVGTHALDTRCHVIFAPVHGELPPARLAEWILGDRLRVRLCLQLHKLIWTPERRGV